LEESCKVKAPDKKAKREKKAKVTEEDLALEEGAK
jgi:hypothetical protein